MSFLSWSASSKRKPCHPPHRVWVSSSCEDIRPPPHKKPEARVPELAQSRDACNAGPGQGSSAAAAKMFLRVCFLPRKTFLALLTKTLRNIYQVDHFPLYNLAAAKLHRFGRIKVKHSKTISSVFDVKHEVHPFQSFSCFVLHMLVPFAAFFGQAVRPSFLADSAQAWFAPQSEVVAAGQVATAVGRLSECEAVGRRLLGDPPLQGLLLPLQNHVGYVVASPTCGDPWFSFVCASPTNTNII